MFDNLYIKLWCSIVNSHRLIFNPFCSLFFTGLGGDSREKEEEDDRKRKRKKEKGKGQIKKKGRVAFAGSHSSENGERWHIG